jgi:CBS-domain-containing membrane protein
MTEVLEVKKWTVQDVMTRDVVTVRFGTSYHDTVSAMATHGVSAVPVVDDSARVLGVVSEADLLRKIEFGSDDSPPRFFAWGTHKKERVKAHAGTAAELMSSPAVTVQPGASLAAAARLLDSEHVKRLPVVNDLGRLVGIVARSDLLSVYLRPDHAIRDDIAEGELRRVLQLDPTEVQVEVAEGIVTLTGKVDRKSTAQIAVHLTRAVPGVIDVVDRLSFSYDDTVVSATTGL